MPPRTANIKDFSLSPLKSSLNVAISKVVNSFNSSDSINCSQQMLTERSRSSSQAKNRASPGLHPEVSTFLSRHFKSPGALPIELFVEGLVHQYPDIFDDRGQDVIFELTQFFRKTLSADGCKVEFGMLRQATARDGLLGLILTSLREMNEKEEDEPALLNLKNIIQEFMESLYKTLQNQIYAKYNQEIRRLVLKTKETEDVLRAINNRITQHYVLFKKGKNKENNAGISLLKAENQRLKQENAILLSQNQILQENLERIHERLLTTMPVRMPANRSPFQPRGVSPCKINTPQPTRNDGNQRLQPKSRKPVLYEFQ